MSLREKVYDRILAQIGDKVPALVKEQLMGQVEASNSSKASQILIYLALNSQECIGAAFAPDSPAHLIGQKVNHIFGISTKNQHVFYKGRPLVLDESDACTIKDLGIGADNFLHIVDKNAVASMPAFCTFKLIRSFTNVVDQLRVSSKSTLANLYSQVGEYCSIDVSAFQLFYLGGFLPPDDKTTIEQAYLFNKCELRFMMSHKKLMLVGKHNKLFQLLRLPGFTEHQFRIFEAYTREQPTEHTDESDFEEHQKVMATIQDHMTSLSTSFQSLLQQQANSSKPFDLEDTLECKLHQEYIRHIQLFAKFAKEGLTQPSLEAKNFVAFALSWSVLNTSFCDLGLLLLENIMFHNIRREYFWQKLDQLITNPQQLEAAQKETAYDPSRLLSGFKQLMNTLKNRLNFTRISTVRTYKLAACGQIFRKLVSTLYDKVDQTAAATYAQLCLGRCILLQKTQTASEVVTILTFGQDRYCGINLPVLSELVEQQDNDKMHLVSVLYALAMYFPVSFCAPTQIQAVHKEINQTILNMLRQEGFLAEVIEYLDKDSQSPTAS